MQVKVRLVKERETKGAVLFNEVDDNGNVLTPNDPQARLGNTYIRKTTFTSAGVVSVPSSVEVQVSWQ